MAYDDYKREGGYKTAKEKNCLRLEDKEHIVQDGDIIGFQSGPKRKVPEPSNEVPSPKVP